MQLETISVALQCLPNKSQAWVALEECDESSGSLLPGATSREARCTRQERPTQLASTRADSLTVREILCCS